MPKYNLFLFQFVMCESHDIFSHLLSNHLHPYKLFLPNISTYPFYLFPPHHHGITPLWQHIVVVPRYHGFMAPYRHGNISPWNHVAMTAYTTVLHLQPAYHSHTWWHPLTMMLFKHYTRHRDSVTPCHKGISTFDFLSRSLDTLDTFLGLCIHTSHFLETACFYLLARLHPL